MKLCIAMAAALCLAGPVMSEEIKLDGKNTKIEFVGKKTDGKHDGGFKSLAGTIAVTNGDFTQAKIQVEIQTDSIYSDDPKLTAHLKSPDFFNVSKHKTAKFVSKEIRKTNTGYVIVGDLTLNGETAPVEFPAKVTLDGKHLHLNAEFSIDRTKFGMTYGKGKINDEVDLKLAIHSK